MGSRDRLDLTAAYTHWVARLSAMRGKRGLEQAIGGQFAAYGMIECDMLRFFGLAPDHYLIDVGCGAGRLAIPLSQTHRGRYLGTDLVGKLLDHARASVAQRNFRFAVVSKLEIPEDDGQADMVCLFSVLTHLLHEQSFLYLREARRVLKAGGTIVFSFLEFAMGFHWEVFARTILDEQAAQLHPLNVFIERNAIAAWAARLELEVVEFRDGNARFVPLTRPAVLDDGTVMADFGNLGQSICVLRRP